MLEFGEKTIGSDTTCWANRGNLSTTRENSERNQAREHKMRRHHIQLKTLKCQVNGGLLSDGEGFLETGRCLMTEKIVMVGTCEMARRGTRHRCRMREKDRGKKAVYGGGRREVLRMEGRRLYGKEWREGGREILNFREGGRCCILHE
ncbi:hypothetical protein Ahy_B02g061369 isoform A [Arachis hypogaea]|uniref:Uncharacterized protein n=1 Tax=Arachis hypogaea TaxID=3818 RepID=A0A445AKU9_ARAHY|nr:hypothetical protein Ahy_B02g061369 isoform A [Arachis hypogaea]